MKRSAFLPFAAVLLLALALLFDRTWRFGEVFSPADVLNGFYPWTYEAARHEPLNVTRSDEAFYHQPLMVTHFDRLLRGDFPEWDPLVLGGTAAFHQGLDVGRALSPLSLPFYLFSPPIAVTLYGPLRLLLAGVLMWLYLAHVGLSPPARAAGALAFSLNGAFLVWLSAPMPTVALWLPLAALGAERIGAGTRGGVPLLAGAIALQFLGAYLPTSLVFLVVAAFWCLGAGIARRRGVGFWMPRALLAAILGVTCGAGAIVPMLGALEASPAASRVMHQFTLPWQNLATFALPDFWGTPLDHNWWYPASGNYPELVTYLGIVVCALAGIGVVAGCSREGPWRARLAGAIALVSLMQMYGWPPIAWTARLPGLEQMNPYRWNVALAFSAAVLAGLGVQALLDAVPSGEERRKRGWLMLATSLAVLAGLAAVSGAALLSELDVLRRHGLQSWERRQVLLFLGLATIVVPLVAVTALGSPRWRRLGAWSLVVLATADLVHATHGFNPTLPPGRLYPETPGLRFLARGVGDGRIAPLGDAPLLPQGHVWGIYGLPVLTGFDFHGDATYQSFVAAATHGPDKGPRWDYVSLGAHATPDLDLLGLLGATLLVTAPTDAVTAAAGYTTVGELVDGRTITQRFRISHNGFRRLDLLPATFARRNSGVWHISLKEVATGSVVGSWRIRVDTLRDLDWLRFEFPPIPRSGGIDYIVEIAAQGSSAGRAATLMATPAGGLDSGVLTVDDRQDGRALWLRTFSSAPDRFPGADLVFSGDLNIYRNPRARPRAWFAMESVTVAGAEQLAAVTSDRGMLAHKVFVDRPLPAPLNGRLPRVIGSDLRQADQRVFTIDAPDGGVVVFSERFDSGWTLTADGRPLDLSRADAVLMAAAVPPGSHRLTLRYVRTDWRIAAVTTVVGLGGILVAFAWVSVGSVRRRAT